MKNNIRRNGNKWNVNELLSLQREYELLEMDIHDIAAIHQRTPWAIIFKLKAEGFISHLKEAKGSKKILINLYEEKKDDVVSSSDSDSDSDYEEDEDDDSVSSSSDSDYEEDEDDDSVSSSSDTVYEDDDVSVSSSDREDDDDDRNLEVDNKINNITKRVWNLETTVKGISAIVKLLFASFLSKPTNNSLSVNA